MLHNMQGNYGDISMMGFNNVDWLDDNKEHINAEYDREIRKMKEKASSRATQGEQRKKEVAKKKRKFLLIGVVVLFFVLVVIPYINVEILSINAEEKLASFDLSCYDNIYCEGTPLVYDCKIYSYQERKKAKVLFVLEDCEFGLMADLEWNNEKNCWEDAGGRLMWTVHGGSAQEFYWPLYYGDKLWG